MCCKYVCQYLFPVFALFPPKFQKLGGSDPGLMCPSLTPELQTVIKEGGSCTVIDQPIPLDRLVVRGLEPLHVSGMCLTCIIQLISLPSQSLKLHHLHLIMKINCNNKCLSTNYLWGHEGGREGQRAALLSRPPGLRWEGEPMRPCLVFSEDC